MSANKFSGRIFFDNPRKNWSHMVSDDIELLHEFAQSIGIKRCHYQNKKNKFQPHYDIHPYHFEAAIAAGATRITRAELLTFLKKHFKK